MPSPPSLDGGGGGVLPSKSGSPPLATPFAPHAPVSDVKRTTPDERAPAPSAERGSPSRVVKCFPLMPPVKRMRRFSVNDAQNQPYRVRAAEAPVRDVA